MAKAQYVAVIPIVAARDARQQQQPFERDPEAVKDGEPHVEPHVAPPRVAWKVTISAREREHLLRLASEGELDWWMAPGRSDGVKDEDIRDEIKRHIEQNLFEFRITSIRAVTTCPNQPTYPFRQSLQEKARTRDQNWYRKILFDPREDAFPGDLCRENGCQMHEFKATAEVRLVGWKHHPGFEIDPHVIFHGDGDGDEPPP